MPRDGMLPNVDNVQLFSLNDPPPGIYLVPLVDKDRGTLTLAVRATPDVNEVKRIYMPSLDGARLERLATTYHAYYKLEDAYKGPDYLGQIVREAVAQLMRHPRYRTWQRKSTAFDYKYFEDMNEREQRIMTRVREVDFVDFEDFRPAERSAVRRLIKSRNLRETIDRVTGKPGVTPPIDPIGKSGTAKERRAKKPKDMPQ